MGPEAYKITSLYKKKARYTDHQMNITMYQNIKEQLSKYICQHIRLGDLRHTSTKTTFILVEN